MRRAAAVLALLLAAVDSRADVRGQSSADSLELRGAGTMMAALQELAETYMTEHPKVTIVLGSESAERALKSLITGVAEMSLAVDDVPDDLEHLAETRGVTLMKTCIFVDGVVPVVAADNPIANLTLKQLRDIFRGEIVNWNEVGGPDAKIAVVSHDRSNGVYEIFKAKVLGDDAVVTPDATTANGDLPGAITQYAIGYVGMSGVGRLRALTVNGIAATVHTVDSGDYPIIRQSCLYQRAPGTALGKSFIAFIESPAGQAALTAHNGVPAKKGRK